MFWYEDEVRRLEKERLVTGRNPDVIFYGSSSIRMWNSLSHDFKHTEVVNLGFGGSTLAACVWFFERVMLHYSPRALVVYAGDNDLGDGRHPEEIFIFFQQLMLKVANRFGELPCYFVSLKPSLSRWHKADQLRYTNNLIESEIIKLSNNWKFIDVFKKMLDKSGQPERSYFMDDRLHLSEKGYQLWGDIINQFLMHR
ncbi:lysophospholipase L1-like esterase [Pedobacter africanus]|uniref:Lysophospholipase L1-like esterase n=1 Tax=Pedobacter africanus TaxID=151894 RepID=A0ACC6KYL4_9SPHI|nr:GDSL-type esterase/lipase family protein [Pedobacter africanus]MDR6784362.1 lysophospholipase L1-like esterase [Pedobacter africanus]